MKKFAMITIVMVLLLSVSGCSAPNNANSNIEKERDVFAMDTYMKLKAYGENADTALSEAEQEILRLESLFNVNDENSDIFKVNKNAGKAVQVSDDTIKMIGKANKISEMTNQAVDPSIYPIVKEWGFTTGDYKIPSDKKLTELLKNVDYRQIKIDDNCITIPKNYAIDAGSVAKGYTSDKIVEIFKKNGITSGIINLGGNVHTVGKKSNGENWKVAIQNPKDSNSNIATIEVDGKCVITSGNYERYFTGDDGNNYWHIMDTKTGKPANNGIISATIIGDSGALCDSLSTAVFVMGTEKAVEFAKQHKEMDFVFITDDMEIYSTAEIENSLRIIGEYSHIIIER